MSKTKKKKENVRIIARRNCDTAMANKKGFLPCEEKDCRNCIACIETDINGNREHCNPKNVKKLTEYL